MAATVESSGVPAMPLMRQTVQPKSTAAPPHSPPVSTTAAHRPGWDNISFVTAADLRFGARLAGWGPERRQSLEHQLAQAETVWPGPDLTDTYAALRAWCVRNGHGLGQKDHEADRWVAATAIWLIVAVRGRGFYIKRDHR